MEIKGKRISIRPLELKDVFHMRNWGYHKNPLLDDYDFPIYSNEEIKRWYMAKAKSFLNKYYGIHNENGLLIGYMGIKNIRLIRRSSTLGIVFDPNYMDQGYGSESLRYYLEYYFKEMKMKIMYLEVADFNSRAYRVYEKMGFEKVGYYLDEFHNPNLDLRNPYYLESKSSFVITEEKIYNYIYKMKLKKDKFMDIIDNM